MNSFTSSRIFVSAAGQREDRALVRRLVALLPLPRQHLTSFHGVYAPHAALRPFVTQPVQSPPALTPAKKGWPSPQRRLLK